SMDGVTMGSAGSTASATEGTQAGKAGHAASHGARTLAIVGGVAAAGVGVAVAAGGGGGSPGSSSSTGGASTRPPPHTGAPPGGGSSSLTGHWVGLAGNGEGITEVISGQGLSCSFTFDITTDLTQSGTTFTGTGTSTTRGVNCGIPLPADLTSIV